jgi:class 3 adenylate cyclase
VGTVAWACAAIVLGWRPQQGVILAYLALATLIWLGVRRFPRTLEASFWAVAVVDLPMFELAQWVAWRGGSDAPGYLLGVNVGLLGLVVLASGFALRRSQSWVIAALCLCAHVTMLMAFGELSASRVIASTLVLGTAASVVALLRRQTLRLVGVAATEAAARGRMQRYFSPAVADRILEGNAEEVRSEHRVITVLVADIRGFTALAAGAEADHVVRWLDDFLAAMVGVIFENGGTLDKFLGDGVLAWFGAPGEQPNHAERAVRCAIRMQEALSGVNARRAAEGLPPLQIGVGVHTGRALVGDIGPRARREYTAIGDTVNTASRVEGLTRPVGVGILVTGSARAAAGDGFQWKQLPPQHIRGKEEPIEVWSVAALDEGPAA